jgi:hypothetical protein
MDVIVLGAGGQLAQAVGRLLEANGHRVLWFRFDRYLVIPGVPARPSRRIQELDRFWPTAHSDLSGLCGIQSRYRWAEDADYATADLIVNTYPSYLSSSLARSLGRRLAGKTLLTVSDRFLGATELVNQLGTHSAPRLEVSLNSGPILSFEASRHGPAQMRYFKPGVSAACSPSSMQSEARAIVATVFGLRDNQVRVLASIWDVAFECTNCLMHVVQDLHNLKRGLYTDRATGSLYDPDAYTSNMVMDLLAMLAERDEVAERVLGIGHRPRSLAEFDQAIFGVSGSAVSPGTVQFRHENAILQRIPRPAWWQAIGFEDVGWCAVPLEQCARRYGVATPFLSRYISAWSNFMGVDYRSIGRQVNFVRLPEELQATTLPGSFTNSDRYE